MRYVRKIINLLLLTCSFPLAAVVIGSDSTVSRQARAFFKKAESLSNILKGFSVFQQGFVLENPGTVASFDAFFPISGDVVLNGGTLELLGDLQFRSPFRIGVGKIKGNSFSIELPSNLSLLDFPSLYYIKLIVNLAYKRDVGQKVYSIDWDYTGNYLAVALNGSQSNNEIKIFKFDAMSFAEVASYDFGSASVNSIRWHPSAHFFATAASGNGELKTWSFNPATNQLSQISSLSVGATNAVAWSPSGNHLAVGRNKDSSFLIYPVTNGSLGTAITASFSANAQVMNNAISWDSSGEFIAVGLKQFNGSELYIFRFNGSTIQTSKTINLDTHVNAVAWMPNASIIAVGISDGTERLLLYSYSNNQLSELTAARVGLDKAVFALRWDAMGRYLAVGKEYAAQGYELEVYYYDDYDNSLHLVSGYSSDSPMRDVSWSPDSEYLVAGDDTNNVYLFDFHNVPFTFNNLKLFLRSRVKTHASIQFEGNCVVNGDGNVLDLSSTTSLVVMPNSTLTLEEIIIKGISCHNIVCRDSSSNITLRDVTWVMDHDFTFTLGSFEFNDDVVMRGDATFIYESAQTSTIAAKARLILESGMTFSYCPPVANDHLLECAENSSTILLDGGGIYAATMGLALTGGKLFVNRNSTFTSDGQAGITLGSGNISGDMQCALLNGMELYVSRGALNYKNVLSSSWAPNTGIIHVGQNCILNLYNALNIGPGLACFDEGSVLKPIGSGGLIGRVYSAGEFTFVNG